MIFIIGALVSISALQPATGANTFKQVFEINGTFTAGTDIFNVTLPFSLTNLDKSVAFLTFEYNGQNQHRDTFRSYNFTDLNTLTIYGNDDTPSSNFNVGFHGTIFEFTSDSDMFVQHEEFTMAELLPEGEFELSIPIAVNATTSFILPTGSHHDNFETSVGSEEFTKFRIINSTFYGLEVGNTPNTGDTVYHQSIVDLNVTTVAVQRGQGTLGSGETIDIVTPSAYNKTNSLLFVSYNTNGDLSQDPEHVAIKATINGDDDLIFVREEEDDNNNTVDYAWELIEFADGFVSVQHFNGTQTDGTSVSLETIPIAVGNLTRSWAIGTVASPFGLGNGMSDSRDTGAFDRATATIKIDSTTQVELVRGDGEDDYNVGLQVIEFLVQDVTEFDVDITDVVTAVDVGTQFNVTKVFSDTATVNDAVITQNMINQTLTDTTTILDQVATNVTTIFNQNQTDTATILDEINLNTTKVLSDTATVLDQVQSNVTSINDVLLNDTATVLDQTNFNVTKSLSDTTTILDQVATNVTSLLTQNLNDTATILDEINLNTTKVLSDTATVLDQVQSNVDSINDVLQNDTATVLDDETFVIDKTIRNVELFSGGFNKTIFADNYTTNQYLEQDSPNVGVNTTLQVLDFSGIDRGSTNQASSADYFGRTVQTDGLLMRYLFNITAFSETSSAQENVHVGIGNNTSAVGSHDGSIWDFIGTNYHVSTGLSGGTLITNTINDNTLSTSSNQIETMGASERYVQALTNSTHVTYKTFSDSDYNVQVATATDSISGIQDLRYFGVWNQNDGFTSPNTITGSLDNIYIVETDFFDEFSGTDDWIDFGTGYGVNTTSNRLDWTSTFDGTHSRTMFDLQDVLGSGNFASDDSWILRSSLNITDLTQGQRTAVLFGLTSTNGTQLEAQDGVIGIIDLIGSIPNGYGIGVGQAVQAVPASKITTSIPLDTTLYMELKRVNSTSASFRIFNDTLFSVPFGALSELTITPDNEDLRFIKLYESGSSGTGEITAHLDDVTFINGGGNTTLNFFTGDLVQVLETVIVKLTTLNANATDTATVTDQTNFNVTKSLLDTTSILDAVINNVTTINDVLQNDTATVTDLISLLINKSAVDVVTTVDQGTEFNVTKVFADVVIVQDNTIIQVFTVFNTTNTDTATILDQIELEITKGIQDSVIVLDQVDTSTITQIIINDIVTTTQDLAIFSTPILPPVGGGGGGGGGGAPMELERLIGLDIQSEVIEVELSTIVPTDFEITVFGTISSTVFITGLETDPEFASWFSFGEEPRLLDFDTTINPDLTTNDPRRLQNIALDDFVVTAPNIACSTLDAFDEPQACIDPILYEIPVEFEFAKGGVVFHEDHIIIVDARLPVDECIIFGLGYPLVFCQNVSLTTFSVVEGGTDGSIPVLILPILILGMFTFIVFAFRSGRLRGSTTRRKFRKRDELTSMSDRQVRRKFKRGR